MSRIRQYPPGVDPKLLIKEAARLLPDPARRKFLRGGASLGALAVLAGCDITDSLSAERALTRISYFNDWVQARLFNPKTLAPTYPDSAVTRPFPFNAYYPEDEAPEVDKADYRLEVGGMVDNKTSWTLDELYALPEETQITRHVCVEGWSAIGKWSGVRLSEFLRRVGADTRAKYVWFRCAEGYSTSIDMPTALHPQTQMTFKFDGEILPRKYGFPMKVRMPTKLGFKNPTHVMENAVTDKYLGGYWEDQGYNWFSGLYRAQTSAMMAPGAGHCVGSAAMKAWALPFMSLIQPTITSVESISTRPSISAMPCVA
jgi:DMSO/TMAO reductase YedYZ molybdopterin-dependent catalytic subunit